MNKNVCKRNKFGYCFFGDKCRNLHVNVICVVKNCDMIVCEKRHPRSCKFYRDYGRCKFVDFCKYNHNDPPQDKSAKQFEIKMTHIEILVSEKEKEISKICQELSENKENLKELGEIVAKQEKVIKDLIENLENEKRIKEKDKAVEIETIKLDVKEELKEIKDVQKECIKFVGGILECIDDMEFDELKLEFENRFPKDEDIVEIENSLESTFINPSMGFSCEKCEFIAKNKGGLKTHIKMKHKMY